MGYNGRVDDHARFDTVPLVMRPARGGAETEACARMMAASEPWLTLGRDYPACLQLLARGDRELFVALSGDEVVGFVLLCMQGAFNGYVQAICMAPPWRGRGSGARLLAFAEERIFRDTANVFLCVSSFNPGAQRFYRRLGYETIGELRDYLVAGHSEILMRKSRGPLLAGRTQNGCSQER